MFVGSGKVQMGVACDSMKQCIMILDKPYIGVFIRGNLCNSVENIKHRLHFCQNIIYNQKLYWSLLFCSNFWTMELHYNRL